MVLSDVALDFMLGALLRLISCTRQLVRNRGYHRAIDASGDVVADIENVAGLQGCSLGHFLRVVVRLSLVSSISTFVAWSCWPTSVLRWPVRLSASRWVSLSFCFACMEATTISSLPLCMSATMR